MKQDGQVLRQSERCNMIRANSTKGWGTIEQAITNSKSRIRSLRERHILEHYGRIGVEALSRATPVDTGKTASMWRYEIEERANSTVLSFHNDNVSNHINIALILNYGHATRNGGWVEGREYIDPAIQPIFEEIARKLRRGT